MCLSPTASRQLAGLLPGSLDLTLTAIQTGGKRTCRELPLTTRLLHDLLLLVPEAPRTSDNSVPSLFVDTVDTETMYSVTTS